MKLAVIPTHIGSKQIPNPNVQTVAGEPMVARSIAAARGSGSFDRIEVSTDDAEIAAVARARGAGTPFIQPPELADDHTPTIPVIAHAIQWYLDRGETVDAAYCIYATTPFIRAEMFNPEHFATRSQDLEEAFHDAGQFYWGRPQAWPQGLSIFSPQSIPLRLPRSRAAAYRISTRSKTGCGRNNCSHSAANVQNE